MMFDSHFQLFLSMTTLTVFMMMTLTHPVLILTPTMILLDPLDPTVVSSHYKTDTFSNSFGRHQIRKHVNMCCSGVF